MKYQPKKRKSTLNLAPMIDIVFLLLIFFLVSSTLQGEEALYNIRVPESSIGAQSDAQIISVFLDAENNIIYNKRRYQREELKSLFTELNKKNNSKVKIYADQKSDFEAVVFLIEKLKNNNFKELSFTLRSKR